MLHASFLTPIEPPAPGRALCTHTCPAIARQLIVHRHHREACAGRSSFSASARASHPGHAQPQLELMRVRHISASQSRCRYRPPKSAFAPGLQRTLRMHMPPSRCAAWRGVQTPAHCHRSFVAGASGGKQTSSVRDASFPVLQGLTRRRCRRRRRRSCTSTRARCRASTTQSSRSCSSSSTCCGIRRSTSTTRCSLPKATDSVFWYPTAYRREQGPRIMRQGSCGSLPGHCRRGEPHYPAYILFHKCRAMHCVRLPIQACVVSSM